VNFIFPRQNCTRRADAIEYFVIADGGKILG